MPITVDEATPEELAALTRQQKAPVGLVRRARAILLLAAGESFATPPSVRRSRRWWNFTPALWPRTNWS